MKLFSRQKPIILPLRIVTIHCHRHHHHDHSSKKEKKVKAASKEEYSILE
jgi:hypothetical protein